MRGGAGGGRAAARGSRRRGRCRENPGAGARHRTTAAHGRYLPLQTAADTAPTVFDKAWREPINLKKIGDEGGVVPILVRYASQQVTKAARRIPGWKGPDQPAEARAAPLDEGQMQRAMELQDTTP